MTKPISDTKDTYANPLIILQTALLFLHASSLVAWLWVYSAFSMIWFVYFMGIAKKSITRMLQYIGLLAGLIGLWFSYDGFSLELAIAFLLLCMASKLYEMHTRKDVYVFLNVALFALAGGFLFDQGLAQTVKIALGVLFVLFTMIRLNANKPTGRLRALGILTLSAVPLMVVLFLFFPRLPPLWSLNLNQSQAITGISDSMSPGDFSNLSQSTELAFRAEFADGTIPSQNQMYWRGLVLSDFDGITWRPSKNSLPIWQKGQPFVDWLKNPIHQFSQDNAIHYKVTLEQTGQPWLFALDVPFTTKKDVMVTKNLTLQYTDKVNQRFSYPAIWLDDPKAHPALTDDELQEYLELPSKGNEKTKQFAMQLLNQHQQDLSAYVQAVQQWILQQNFRYTLSPPLLYKNRVDEFLFDSKAGFCEHYASSFAFLMRAVGIPARIVVGYQGGQLGRDGKSWEVRQMDAHAWVEIWTKNGWDRIDPTALVSPDRVEQGMDEFSQQQGAALFGDGIMAQLSYQQFQLLKQARRLFDQASYYWQRNVVGFDQDQQRDSLFKWFNISSVYQQVMMMFAICSLLVTLVIGWIWWRRRKIWDSRDLIIIHLSKKLSKQQPSLARQDNEGVLAWLQRIAPLTQSPELVHQLQKGYRESRYGRQQNSQQPLKTLAKQIQSKA